jgi:hypothetical protein
MIIIGVIRMQQEIPSVNLQRHKVVIDLTNSHAEHVAIETGGTRHGLYQQVQRETSAAFSVPIRRRERITHSRL